jgi:eukaryotic-like serine/threonine-protein kinase
MDGARNFRDSFLEAAALGLLATATLYVAPLHIADCLDRWLFDIWSQIAPSVGPPGDILLVRLDDPTSLDAIAQLARDEHARLLISTQPQAPTAQNDDFVLGPTELPVGAMRLQRTQWRNGGHLWFDPDMDGVVRNDMPLIDDGTQPSLALRAARKLSGESTPPREASKAERGEDRRRWLRFYPGRPFPEVTAAQAFADPTRLRDKVLIAGGPAQSELTPLGPLTTNVLLAHAISGYLQGVRINVGIVGAALGWVLAAVLIGVLGVLRAPTRPIAWLALTGAALGILVVGTIAFGAANLWLPVTGPLAWVVLAGSLLAIRVPRAARPKRLDGDLVAARQAASGGQLADAWSRYRQISPVPALLPELYELASQLDAAGNDRCAADLFHRIAQVDGEFRDVARRLVRANQPQSAGVTVNRDEMPAAMGRYQLLEPIGRGAMGYVYLGRDPKINRIVAIKAVNLAAEVEPAELEEASRNFLREAEIAGRLSHPNIVTIFDVGETNGLAYIAMEYLKGRHLSEFVVPERLLPVNTVLDLLSRTADALDYAHSQNVVHRDIKPANIMYDSIADGLKITDFGIARLIDVGRTRTGIVLGTPAFMSPEQLEGKNVNGHTDLFALGVSLYQLLTGHLPFRGASMTKLMFVIANEPHESVTAVRPDLPPRLNPIIDRALAKEPSERFQTGAEMAAALRTAALTA